MSHTLKRSSTAQPLMFLLIDSADHIAGKAGLSPVVTVSKSGGAFAGPAGAVTELADGWYRVAGNAADTDTLGPLILHATAAGADPVDVLFDVVAYDPQSTTMGLDLAAIAAAVWADAPAPTPLEDFAVAVRDVDNSSPAPGSLGEAVNDGVGGGGGATPAEVWAHTPRGLTDKAGFALGPAGLDAIPVTAPTGVATTFPAMVVALWRRFYKKATKTDSQIRTFADNGSTVVTTQSVSDDGTTETLGSAT